jgi:hypothetical protein
MAKVVDGANISYSFDLGDVASSSTKMAESGCPEAHLIPWPEQDAIRF